MTSTRDDEDDDDDDDDDGAVDDNNCRPILPSSSSSFACRAVALLLTLNLDFEENESARDDASIVLFFFNSLFFRSLSVCLFLFLFRVRKCVVCVCGNSLS